MNEKGISPPPRFIRGLVQTLTDVINYLQDMDVWFRAVRDNFARVRTYTATLDPTNVGANTTSEQTFTVTGLATTDIVTVNKPTHDAGLGIVNARVPAKDTLALTFMNTTGSGIDPPSEDYTIVAVRR